MKDANESAASVCSLGIGPMRAPTFVMVETARGDGTTAAYVDMTEVCAVETRDDGATLLMLRSGKAIVVTDPGLAPGFKWPENVNVVTP